MPAVLKPRWSKRRRRRITNEMVKKTQTQYDLNEKDRRDRSAEQTLEFNTWAGGWLWSGWRFSSSS